MTNRYGRKLYRSRRGKLMGVCRGIADYFDIDALIVRILFILAVLWSGIFPFVIAYFLMGVLLDTEPRGYHPHDIY